MTRIPTDQHTMPSIDVTVEPMTPADWEAVRAIYMEGLASGQATFETEAPSWEQWDDAHHSFQDLPRRKQSFVFSEFH